MCHKSPRVCAVTDLGVLGWWPARGRGCGIVYTGGRTVGVELESVNDSLTEAAAIARLGCLTSQGPREGFECCSTRRVLSRFRDKTHDPSLGSLVVIMRLRA